MTEYEYRTFRTRDQIADALGGGALADIFIPLWSAIGQDEAEQLQTIGYALGKLPNLDEWPTHPITPYDAAIITAHLQMPPRLLPRVPTQSPGTDNPLHAGNRRPPPLMPRPPSKATPGQLPH